MTIMEWIKQNEKNYWADKLTNRERIMWREMAHALSMGNGGRRDAPVEPMLEFEWEKWKH